MSKKWIDLGPGSELIAPEDIKSSVDSESTDDTVPSAKCLNTMAGDIEEAIRIIRGGRVGGWIYGYVIDESDPDPSTRVSYIEDNKNYSPLYMDFANDALVWGSWKSFVEEYFRPAMLRSDGTIDYYLDPNDLTKKTDGVTASDVSNTSYDGNAMLIVKPIYYNICRNTEGKLQVKFSNVKQGADWYNWTHLKSDGTYADFCGWPLFTGSVVSSKLRSLATGAVPQWTSGFSDDYAYATANGSNWYTTTWADEMMIRLLFPLLCKSTDSQSSIGGGASNRSSIGLTCGALSNKGYFWGKSNVTSSTNYGCKFLGMENTWGERMRRPAGIVGIDGRLYLKMTPSTVDGTAASGFKTSTTASDYVGNYIGGLPYAADLASGGNIIEVDSNRLSATAPTMAYGSDNQGWMCDTIYSQRTGTVFGVGFGGECSHGRGGGVFAFNAAVALSFSYWGMGSSLSYHFF